MPPKKRKRFSIDKAFSCLRDFGKGHISVFDPESLRQAAHTITGYLEKLELYAGESAKRKAVQDAEKS